MNDEVKMDDPTGLGMKMMIGTNGRNDYLIFARKGQNILGIKPYRIMDAARFEAPGCTYLELRLRAATAQAETLPELPSSGVVTMPVQATKAWPIEWDKQAPNNWVADTMYGSKSVHLIIRGNPETDLPTIKSHVENGNIAQQFTDYFMGLIPAEDRFITPIELRAWLQAYYVEIFGKIFQSFEEKKHLIEEAKQAAIALGGSIGTVSATAELLKKQHDKISAEGDDDGDDDVDLDAGQGEGGEPEA